MHPAGSVFLAMFTIVMMITLLVASGQISIWP